MARIVVIGLGRFGSACATRLYDKGAEVLAIDRDHGRVDEISDRVTAAISCDATQVANLEAYDVGEMDAAVVAMGSNFEASVLATMVCRQLGVGRVLAKANTRLQKQVLHEVGADQVFLPEEEMGARVADHVLDESIVDFVELPAGYSLRRLDAPAAWIGHSLADLQLIDRARVLVVQVVRPGAEGAEDQRIPLPDGQVTLRAGDKVDVVADDVVLEQIGADLA